MNDGTVKHEDTIQQSIAVPSQAGAAPIRWQPQNSTYPGDDGAHAAYGNNEMMQPPAHCGGETVKLESDDGRDAMADEPPVRKRRLNSSTASLATAGGSGHMATPLAGEPEGQGDIRDIRGSWAGGETHAAEGRDPPLSAHAHLARSYLNGNEDPVDGVSVSPSGVDASQSSFPEAPSSPGTEEGGGAPSGHQIRPSSSPPSSSSNNYPQSNSHPPPPQPSHGIGGGGGAGEPSSSSAGSMLVTDQSQQRGGNSENQTNTSLRARNLMCQLAAAENFDVNQFDSNVWDILAATVEYKVRSLVDEAVRIVKRSPKRGPQVVLNSSAVQLAAQLLGMQCPLAPCQATSRSEDPVQVDDILNQFENEMPPPLPFMRVQWATINGRTVVEPGVMQSTRSRGELNEPWRYLDVPTFKKEFVDLEKPPAARIGCGGGSGMSAVGCSFGVSLLFSTQTGPTIGTATTDSEVLCVPRGLEHSITEEQKLYLDRVCGAMRSVHGDALQKMTLDKIVRSLGTGRFPPKLVPFLVSLICREMARVLPAQDPETLFVVLQVTQALISNPHVSLNAYLHQILNLLFTAVLSPLPGGPTMEGVQRAIPTRGVAAELLARIVMTGGTSLTSVLTSVMDVLSAVLVQLHLPLPTLIGALMAAKCLGVTVFRKIVTPTVLRDLTDTVKRSLIDLNTERQLGGITLQTEVKEYLKTVLLDLLLSDR